MHDPILKCIIISHDVTSRHMLFIVHAVMHARITIIATIWVSFRENEPSLYNYIYKL